MHSGVQLTVRIGLRYVNCVHPPLGYELGNSYSVKISSRGINWSLAAYYSCAHYSHFTYYFVSAPLSDERAQEIVDNALEFCSLDMRNLVAVITGLMGSGKTWLLSRLFNQLPPEFYTSTGVAEQSLQGLLHHMANVSFNSQLLACIFQLLPRSQEPSASVSTASAPPSLSTTSPSYSTTTPATSFPGTPNASSSTFPESSVDPKVSTMQSMVRLVKS